MEYIADSTDYRHSHLAFAWPLTLDEQVFEEARHTGRHKRKHSLGGSLAKIDLFLVHLRDWVK